MMSSLMKNPRDVVQKMNDLDFYTPHDIPDSIKIFDSDIRQLGVGKSGKNGSIKIVFENDPAGKTIICDQFAEVPFHIQRVLHYDMTFPDMAYLYIISASGGILQGDRYRIDITALKGTKTHITTQGATRIYGMDSNSATQMINITLEEDAYMEFVPDQIIPYRNSRFYQRTNLNIHDSATMIYSEIISPGRVAMGESFEYDICYLKAKAVNQNGTLRFADAASIEPKRYDLESFGIMGEDSTIGSVYVVTKEENITPLHEKIKNAIKSSGASGGASTMMGGGLLARIIGSNTTQTKDIVMNILRHAREICTGHITPEIRKS